MIIPEYVSIDKAVSDYIGMVGIESGVDKARIKETADDIVSELTFKQNLIHGVSLIKVEGNKAILPPNLSGIVQLLYKEEDNRERSTIMVQEWKQSLTDDCDLVMSVECPECVDPECEDCDGYTIWSDDNLIGAHPQFHHLGGSKFKTRHGGIPNKDQKLIPLPKGFSLIRPAQHKFHAANYHVKGCLNLDRRLTANCVKEYRLDYPAILVNFEEGWLLVSHLSHRTDEDGYRLIPNVPVVFEAIRWGIREREAYIEQLKEVEPRRAAMLERDVEKSRMKKLEAMTEAAEKLRYQSTDEWWNTMQNIYSRMHNYYDWYENLGRYKPDMYTKQADRLHRM